MENRTIIIALLVLASVGQASAYSPETTHRSLTSEMVEHYNEFYPEKIIRQEHKEALMDGSRDEDRPSIRVLYHFYDPIRRVGLKNARPSSRDWVQSPALQKNWFHTSQLWFKKGEYKKDSDFTWQRAVYEYVYGDKVKAMHILGHTLHLIEDVAVPDHTRDDAHPPAFDWKSPYEGFTAAQAVSDRDLSRSLVRQTRRPIILPTLDSYFDSMAVFSNTRFFSKDTIFDKKYHLPVVAYEKDELINGKTFRFGYASAHGKEYRLVKIEKGRPIFSFRTPDRFYLKDPANLVLIDYWDILSESVVEHGSGVLAFFFGEVENEKKTGEIKKKFYPTEIYARKHRPVIGFFSTAITQDITKYIHIPELSFITEIASTTSLAQKVIEAVTPNPVAFQQVLVEVVPGYGGGGGGNVVIPAPAVPVLPVDLEPIPVASTTEPVPETPTPDPEPEEDNGEETVATSTPPVDPIPEPAAVVISIEQCADSLSPDVCVLPPGEMTIRWVTNAEHISHFTLKKNHRTYATTTSTSLVVPLEERRHSFSVEVHVETGEGVISDLFKLEAARPIIIDEIFWSGTASSSAHEWITLQNKSDHRIDLGKMILRAEDGVPHIALQGMLNPQERYLITRGTIENIVSDLATSFSGTSNGSGLENAGEQLHVAYLNPTREYVLDSTPYIDDCGGHWCQGIGSPNYCSMQRVSDHLDGTFVWNWVTGPVQNSDNSTGTCSHVPDDQHRLRLHSIGYYCEDDRESYLQGGYHLPSQNSCAYLLDQWEGPPYFGGVFKGIIGSSTLVGGHTMGGRPIQAEREEIVHTSRPGDSFITLISESQLTGGTYTEEFIKLFTTGSGSVPHYRFGFIEWFFDHDPWLPLD